MKKIAFLFPGQGSQTPGMGQDIAGKFPAADAMMLGANDVLEFDLRALCFNGPEEALKATEITQPALFATSAATFVALRSAGIRPWAVAGHSLGEYSALYAAGALDFEAGLRLVRTRGLAMAQAGSARGGAMAAILGLDGGRVRALCAEASAKGVVVAANFNDPQQTVISGEVAAVEAACELAKAAGAKRAVVLPVSGAFHSPLVAPAAEAMRTALADATVSPPTCLFLNNADVEPLTDPDAIRGSLVRQITSPVRWVETMERLVREGAEAFVEVGSGRVLAGLAKRCAKEVPCYTTEGTISFDAAVAALA